VSTATTFTIPDIPRLFEQLRGEKFYGRVSFELREGEVTLIRAERRCLIEGFKD
jgi:hypothetical protein